MMNRKWAFRLIECVFISLFAISVIILALVAMFPVGREIPSNIHVSFLGFALDSNDVLIIAALTALISAIGTISAVILGWKNDRRTERETELRIKKLELELENMKLQKEGVNDSLNAQPKNSIRPTPRQQPSRSASSHRIRKARSRTLDIKK